MVYNKPVLMVMILMAGLVFSMITIPPIDKVFAQDNDDVEEEEDKENDNGNSDTLSGSIASTFGVEEPDLPIYNNTTVGGPTSTASTSDTPNTTTGGPQTAADINRVENINDNGVVENPGGITSQTVIDDPMTTPPSNIEDMVTSDDARAISYEDLQFVIQGKGFPILDMQTTIETVTGDTIVIIRGHTGVPEPPNMMEIVPTARDFGFESIQQPVFIGGAWQLEFKPITGN